MKIFRNVTITCICIFIIIISYGCSTSMTPIVPSEKVYCVYWTNDEHSEIELSLYFDSQLSNNIMFALAYENLSLGKGESILISSLRASEKEDAIEALDSLLMRIDSVSIRFPSNEVIAYSNKLSSSANTTYSFLNKEKYIINEDKKLLIYEVSKESFIPTERKIVYTTE